MDLLEQVARLDFEARALRPAATRPSVASSPERDAAIITALGMLLARCEASLFRAMAVSSFSNCSGVSSSYCPEATRTKKLARTDWQMSIDSSMSAKPRIGQPESHGAADRRLVGPDQLRGRIGVAITDSSDQLVEGGSIKHDHTPA